MGIGTGTERLPHVVLPPMETVQAALLPKGPRAVRPALTDAPVQHEYLAIRADYGPLLPQLNRAVSNVYPSLPASKTSVTYSNDRQAAVYAAKDRRAAVCAAIK